jgi:uncharacterized membrane protein YkvA (DUF1232 family)
MFATLQEWARSIKRDVRAVYAVSRDPRTPWYVKFLAFAVIAYALSPIDLIPDFIPVLGYVDDLLIVPLGIWLVIKLIPPEIWLKHRADRADVPAQFGAAGAAIVVCLWLMLTAAGGWWLWTRYE